MKKPSYQIIAKHSIETLHHFQCGQCSQWWSIGDAEDREYFCPWCGVKNRSPVELDSPLIAMMKHLMMAESSGQIEACMFEHRDTSFTAYLVKDTDGFYGQIAEFNGTQVADVKQAESAVDAVNSLFSQLGTHELCQN